MEHITINKMSMCQMNFWDVMCNIVGIEQSNVYIGKNKH